MAKIKKRRERLFLWRKKNLSFGKKWRADEKRQANKDNDIEINLKKGFIKKKKHFRELIIIPPIKFKIIWKAN